MRRLSVAAEAQGGPRASARVVVSQRVQFRRWQGCGAAGLTGFLPFPTDQNRPGAVLAEAEGAMTAAVVPSRAFI